jgi:hypothetical protein
MAAKLGTVTLPYGIQEVAPSQQSIVPVNRIPLGKPIFQDLGMGETSTTLQMTVSTVEAEALAILFEGTRLFHVDLNEGTTFGLIVTNIGERRSGQFPNCIELSVSGYKLDSDVTNIVYDLIDDFDLAPSSGVISTETDEIIDTYDTWVVVESTGSARAWVQTSPDKVDWTSYPDDLGWEVNNERRIISLNHLTGYARVVISNEDSENITVSADMYLSKQL